MLASRSPGGCWNLPSRVGVHAAMGVLAFLRLMRGVWSQGWRSLCVYVGADIHWGRLILVPLEGLR